MLQLPLVSCDATSTTPLVDLDRMVDCYSVVAFLFGFLGCVVLPLKLLGLRSLRMGWSDVRDPDDEDPGYGAG